MISLRKVASLKYIYINENHWLYTLQICSVWKSRVEISHTLISFLQFFLCGQPYRFRDISQTSELKSTTDHFSASTCFIHFDGLCNYIHSFQKQSAANVFKNNRCFPDQEHVGHYINRFTTTGLNFFIKYLLRTI